MLRQVAPPLTAAMIFLIAFGGARPRRSMAAQEQNLDAWTVEQFRLAQDAQRKNQLDEAANEYQLVISRNPRFAAAYLNLGIVEHQQRKYSEAVKALRTAASLNPRLLGAQLFLGIDEYLTEDFRDAREHLTKALQLSPTDRQA